MKNQFIKSILYVSFLMSSLITFAQDPEDPFEDPGVAAPIDSYVVPTILLVVLVTFFIFRKRLQNNTIN